MSDCSFSEDPELQKLNAQVLEDPEEFENWEKLVRAAEGQEGGLSRNSSAGAISYTRAIYDQFLARFPLFFGYWKKYADLEFSIGGSEAAEMVYERGVASVGISVDLWANYCAFKVETSHDADVIRELFERGANSAGLDFLAHPFWDKYLEFEERLEAQDRIFAILDRIIHIPMHQYARYFERYRGMAASRPLIELAPQNVLLQFRQDTLSEGGPKQKNEREMEQEMRSKVDNLHLEIFHRTQTETTKRWTYESEVKRPYYHVTELDESQLVNWRKYLDFEEMEGDYARTKFLYERCVVTAANYEEFWLRYARWMLAQPARQEEVRSIYQRASWIYVPIARAAIRLHYAQFEEAEGRADVAVAIHEAILMNMPTHVETIKSLANVCRRQYGLESATEVLGKRIRGGEGPVDTRGALVSEWARLIWKVKGSPEEARQIYQKNSASYLDCRTFWVDWLDFEIQQPTSESEEPNRYQHTRSVFELIRKNPSSPALIKDLSSTYFTYLKERGGKDAMKEYMFLDQQLHGSSSMKETLEIGKHGNAQSRMMLENGNSGVAAIEAAIR
ncbi:hypothetical protein LTR37_006966 [Vermiconidia calcicola]|uniref:Uncharacterized protein n=1 Tax=Vermiconidia calcicola TaxID=1690605 RepID=A0ACC3NEY2_9PEZI|nr:hypothetical protein LTR37_006966 [Vermiconidia calcicola]